MTTDDILRMAREAGFHARTVFMTGHEPLYFVEPVSANSFAALERFAALVAAAEREACAISCEVNAARWIDSGGKQWGAAHECADAIRARGTK